MMGHLPIQIETHLLQTVSHLEVHRDAGAVLLAVERVRTRKTVPRGNWGGRRAAESNRQFPPLTVH